MLSFKKFYKLFLKEATSKTVVFVFGRMNPPTNGHEKMLMFAKKVADKENADLRIYVSHSQDSKKNPLSYDQKIDWLKQGVPSLSQYIQRSTQKTAFKVVENELAGYEKIIMVVGEDRAEEFTTQLTKYYSNVEVRHIERLPGAISASAQREAVKNDDFDSFKKGCPSGLSNQTARKLFDLVKSQLQ